MDLFEISMEARKTSCECFTPLQPCISNSFWCKCIKNKLELDRVDNVGRKIWGYYSHISNKGSLVLDASSFNETPLMNVPGRVSVPGFHYNVNSYVEFKRADTTKIFNLLTGCTVIDSIINDEAMKNNSLLMHFLLFTFCDLKTNEIHFSFILPTIEGNVMAVEASIPVSNLPVTEHLWNMYKNGFKERNDGGATVQYFAFVFKKDSPSTQLISIAEYVNLFMENKADNCNLTKRTLICFIDPTDVSGVPGWPLRNLLIFLKERLKGLIFGQTIYVLAWRGRERLPGVEDDHISDYMKSELMRIHLTGPNIDHACKNSKGETYSRVVKLKESMDEKSLSMQAAELNLSLIRWRLEPHLKLELIANTRCLLIGAGTLGSAVARSLLAWGVKFMTFLDCDVVKPSNPLRQSLYTFADAQNSVPKAEAAAKAIRAIAPHVLVQGVVLNIPVLGKVANMDDIRNELQRLRGIVNEHDAIFVLTDSRESRYLPTVFASIFGKLAITVAIGYDSYLIMRHGGVNRKSLGPKLACYFCGDITAPGNSLVDDRTLDKKCTVSRPGAASIAAAEAVELFVSVRHHEDMEAAPGNSNTILGILPHSIRGKLADFSRSLQTIPALQQCVACSDVIRANYEKHGDEFVERIMSSEKYLEEITGLSAVQKRAEDMEKEVKGFDDFIELATTSESD